MEPVCLSETLACTDKYTECHNTLELFLSFSLEMFESKIMQLRNIDVFQRCLSEIHWVFFLGFNKVINMIV